MSRHQESGTRGCSPRTTPATLDTPSTSSRALASVPSRTACANSSRMLPSSFWRRRKPRRRGKRRGRKRMMTRARSFPRVRRIRAALIAVLVVVVVQCRPVQGLRIRPLHRTPPTPLIVVIVERKVEEGDVGGIVRGGAADVLDPTHPPPPLRGLILLQIPVVDGGSTRPRTNVVVDVAAADHPPTAGLEKTMPAETHETMTLHPRPTLTLVARGVAFRYRLLVAGRIIVVVPPAARIRRLAHVLLAGEVLQRKDVETTAMDDARNPVEIK
mmetsp:Transcript_6314/g.13745  ORF Transcript_6314/g.13745 Transcript_6314/m.13745 type:complete len:271 (-) Transcript_6314:433-1245(-)